MGQHFKPAPVVPAPGIAAAADPFAQARQYLARVCPWPEVPGSAYIDVVWTFQGQSFDKPAWTGRACTFVNEAINGVQFALKGANTLGIYACLSTQRECQEKTSAKGFKCRLAIRNQPNAVALKTLWIDVDTKITEDPKKPKDAYKDLTEAAEALAAFIKAAGLPRPSMIVCSGGGLQPYWVMSRALTPDEWRPLAFALAEATKRHGLKCDAGCTIDSARVFRIPNTVTTRSTRLSPPGS
jgi:hypothetical protein